MADAGLGQLVQLFSGTVSNDKATITQAEEQLKTISQQPGFAVSVLKVVAAAAGVPEDVRLAAAVNFKNTVKYRWVPTEVAEEMGVKPIAPDEKTQIKTLITTLMLSGAPLVRAQLGEALALISDHDFPAQWPTLLPELVQQLGSNEDLAVISGVCQTANSIFKRYRNQISSNELVGELDASQQQFAPVALSTLQKVSAQLGGLAGNPAAQKLALGCVRLLCRIFFSLNALGVTPLMDSQLDAWMEAFNTYLTMDIPGLEESDPEKEGALDGVKAAVCANINLFMEKNEEDFAKYLQTFVTNVWHLLVKVSSRTGQDNLAMSAIRFLTTVARSVHHTLFQGPGVLQQVCEAIVLPNLRVRDEDEECFEMNAIEYIRRDSEGSDSDTRRRTAADLVRALTEKFEAQVTGMFTDYVSKLLQEYAANPATNWKSKDAAVYLVLAVTVKGRTGERGATTTNSLVNVEDFLNTQVLPELQALDINERAMLKADALKFVTTFRSQLPPAAAGALFPAFIRLLGSESVVVHSYAATAIERFLALKDGGQPRLPVEVVSPHATQLLEAMFAAFRHADSGENEYVMKAIMRLIMYLGTAISPVVPLCLQLLTGMLAEVCKNPKSPGFNHYLFESVAALVRYGVAADPANITKAEDLLFPAFDSVLTQDVQEFHPYVFQVLAQLIELSLPPLRQSYMLIFPGLLTPLFWERPGNIPPLTRLLVAYLTKAPDAIGASQPQLTAVLGVFQKLIASKANDQYGFQVLTALVNQLPAEVYRPYMATIWQLLFQRLQGTRTPKFARGFTLFVSAAVLRLGAADVASSMDGVQPNVFSMVIDQVWIPTASTAIEGGSEDKLVAVAATRCLTNCPPLLANKPVWDKMKVMLEGKLAGAGLAVDGAAAAASTAAAGAEYDDENADLGYTAAFAKLVNAPVPHRPVLQDIPDVRTYAEGRLQQFINNGHRPIAE